MKSKCIPSRFYKRYVLGHGLTYEKPIGRIMPNLVSSIQNNFNVLKFFIS